MANKTQITLTGTKEMCETLQGLAADIRANILGKAVDAGSQPIVDAAKRMAPVDTGALRNSISHKVVKDANVGHAYAVIGPDRAYYEQGQRIGGKLGSKFARVIGSNKPANYAHLVEYGHVNAKRGSAHLTRKSRRNPGVADLLGQSLGFVPAHPFLRPAAMIGADAAAAIMADVIDNELGKSIRKRAKSAA